VPTQDFKEIAGVSKFIVITVAIQMAMSAVRVLVLGAGTFLPAPDSSPEHVAGSESSIHFGLVDMISGPLSLLLMIAIAWQVCDWMIRIYLNLERAQVPGLKYTARNCALNWFMPFDCFFKPLQAAKEMYAASEHREGGSPNSPADKAPLVFGVWWISWVACCVIGNFSWWVFYNNQKWHLGMALGALSSIAAVVAGIAFVRIVKEITARHESFLNELRSDD